jgi:hypothetical protein
LSAAYDAWREDLLAQRRPEGYADGLEAFFAITTRGGLPLFVGIVHQPV